MGDPGGGFWVVAVWGEQCIWFNDIEGGFNVGGFEEFGEISEYTCGQSDLHAVVAGCNFGLDIRNAD